MMFAAADSMSVGRQFKAIGSHDRTPLALGLLGPAAFTAAPVSRPEVQLATAMTRITRRTTPGAQSAPVPPDWR